MIDVIDTICKDSIFNFSEIEKKDIDKSLSTLSSNTIKNTSEQQFRTEFECEFLGSTNTLINPTKLRQLSYKDAIQHSAGLSVYEQPKKDHVYFITCDVSRGTKNDNSAFVVMDVTEIPYRVVATFKDNEIKPLMFPHKINTVAKAYNHAFVLVEVNDIGEQVSNNLHYDLEYDNIVMCYMRGRAGQIMGGGYSGGKAQMGVRTTKAVKKLGCSNLKQIVESDKMIIEDFDIINELSTFIVKGNQIQAEEGSTDDLAMCLVLFAWACDQTYFKELTDVNIRAKMFAETQKQLESDMSPFGFVDNGVDDPYQTSEYGEVWTTVDIPKLDD